jgi:hypothetical protein
MAAQQASHHRFTLQELESKEAQIRQLQQELQQELKCVKELESGARTWPRTGATVPAAGLDGSMLGSSHSELQLHCLPAGQQMDEHPQGLPRSWLQLHAATGFSQAHDYHTQAALLLYSNKQRMLSAQPEPAAQLRCQHLLPHTCPSAPLPLQSSASSSSASQRSRWQP